MTNFAIKVLVLRESSLFLKREIGNQNHLKDPKV